MTNQFDQRRIIPTVTRTTKVGNDEVFPAPSVIVEFFVYANPIFRVLDRLYEKASYGQDVAKEVEDNITRLNDIYYEISKGHISKDGELLNLEIKSPPIGLG